MYVGEIRKIIEYLGKTGEGGGVQEDLRNM
jgi:hypothetical protein